METFLVGMVVILMVFAFICEMCRSNKEAILAYLLCAACVIALIVELKI